MKNKKGLSTVVTSLIIILLVLVAVGIIWIVVVNIISSGTEQMSLGKLTMNLEIKEVKVNENNIEVRVKRNPGAGELSGIKFIVSDGVNTEIFEETDITLEELAQRNFVFNLGELNSSNIETVSIAPILKSGAIGNIADSYQVKEGGGNGGASYQNCAADLNGICCGSGAMCQGGSFQSSSDCGSLCCVGGICCTPDCSCTSSTCVGSTCPDSVCGTTCAGTLAPDCGTRKCGPAPNGCGSADECGTCNATSNCVSGVCVGGTNTTEFIQSLGGVSWWRFEGDASDEIGGNDGVVNGATLTSGKFGQAYRFDGVDDYINCEDITSFIQLNQPWTVTGFVLLNDLPLSLAGAFGFYDTSDDTNILIGTSWSSGDKIKILSYDETPGEGSLLTKDIWYYFGVTYDGSKIYAYLEGELDYSVTPTSNNWQTATEFMISHVHRQGIDDWWNGTIDEVMIFNRSLSATEIQELYNLDLG